MKQSGFDVIVIGGGHAGCEAAHAAARSGSRTALVTMRRSDIGVMSCNPAIGGLGKGHLVREIDALDGVMSRCADASGIQFRLLNRRKGPAVQGPRAQTDRILYRRNMLRLVETRQNLSIIEGEVVDFVMHGQAIEGVMLGDGTKLSASAVILTTGTFLRGVIHVGDQSSSGGRLGDKSSERLSERLVDWDVPLGRLKTGTPPRLDGQSIAWDNLESQPGDPHPTMFSFLSKEPLVRQISCGITHTNERTHEIIRENLEKSAMYGGRIKGTGPRYCPSIEDKVVRFADKSSHQIFLEPEGLDVDTVYPNGISTSLPVDIQEMYVRSVAGLEAVKIVQPGYAIEYDFVDPRALDRSLSLTKVQGLFLAGQINGTTGYEEAAAQGLVAGLNAARYSNNLDPAVFSRTESYIGVMIDDLTSRGVSEPYRMFTSRAEYRLSLRADNADQRLTPLGLELGCIGLDRRVAFEQKMERLEAGRSILTETTFTSRELANAGVVVSQDGQRRSLFHVLSIPAVDFSQLDLLDNRLCDIDEETKVQLTREAQYVHYIDRQKRDIEAFKRDENEDIPPGFDFSSLDGLSNELRSKFVQAQPKTLAHAARIDGVTPAALALILAKLRQAKRFRA